MQSVTPIAAAVSATLPQDVEMPPLRVSAPEPETCTIKPEMAESLTAAGAAFDGAHEARKRALEDVLRLLGDAPPYAVWMAARAYIVAGYLRRKPNATEDARNKFWERFCKAMADYCAEDAIEFVMPSKPKSESPEAAKKRAQRAASPTKGIETIEDARTAQALFGALANPNTAREDVALAVESAAGKIDPETAERIKTMSRTEAANAYANAVRAEARLAKAAEKEKAKTAEALLKPRRDALQKIVKDAKPDALAIIEAAADLANESTSPEARAAAWAILTAVAPKAGKAKPADKTKRAA